MKSSVPETLCFRSNSNLRCLHLKVAFARGGSGNPRARYDLLTTPVSPGLVQKQLTEAHFWLPCRMEMLYSEHCVGDCCINFSVGLHNRKCSSTNHVTRRGNVFACGCVGVCLCWGMGWMVDRYLCCFQAQTLQPQ